MRRLWMLLLAVALLAAATGVWAISRPIQNGQDTMGVVILHSAYGGL